MLTSKNPIIVYQLLKSLNNSHDTARTFTFYRKFMMTHHTETEYEQKWKKSVLSDETKKLVSEYSMNIIKEYYRNLPSLGKVYIDEKFYKLAIPTNTTASGSGLDVLPTGSRVPLTEDNIRTFVHWKNAFDIDSSLIIVDKDDNRKTLDFRSYHIKPYGDSILFSGDVTSSNGAEYFDIKIDELDQLGYKYIIQEFHGYCSKLNQGEIYAGYQNKKDLQTQAWDPKNIAMQYRVIGDSRGAFGYAIDIKKRELKMIVVI